MIRQHSPTNRHPTCYHFKGALKSSILTRLSTPLSRGSNCQKDENEILFDFHDIVFPNISKPKIDKLTDVPSIPEIQSSQDIPILQIPEDNSTTEELQEIENYFKKFEMQPTVYVSGYIAYSVLKKIECLRCRDSLTISSPVENSIYNYISLREWWKEKQSLTYPTIKLCETVDVARKVFEEYLLPCLHRHDLCVYSKDRYDC
ncbi:unnamed protein product [Colias eurytheme]|nr:unnamed protein product [Colias eurytheme]